MNSPETPATSSGHHRPRGWMLIESILVLALYLLVVTVAWVNEPGSPWRLGLVVVSWGLATFMVARGIAAKRRLRHLP